MSRRSKEREAKRKKRQEQKPRPNQEPRVTITYTSPMEEELDSNGRFIYATAAVMFKSFAYPSNFEINAQDYDVLQEGELIGTSRSGQMLYWINNMIIAKG
ncbi:MAG: hypothetical protein GW762_05310 [Candidatus Pacebacteria bacterium]|nr:hypothetical protein [Candidatus Paceibacterota bacterium]PIR63821.1 MAG: hypothetical protein COU64_02520 [Candidatus Pacebacteria bacterium CG10_big_fil_rev_8_21_14_0_10_40_26]PIZ78792.1 MAG: hypothetical protein COY01_03270 [Candidatus Pacebacteria bacterium CG_4_10_14_0_2_um_filter_40_20]PJA68775.1 MAG: hypothetical protein CO156_03525 [Candidatus Pacebacteria bacterium CG_4_9_14_3_um_filter_40_12]PJC41152.1 MAG: hypothetical protein CO041_06010 [Candidatus Pacebacteria bacterium CG_4_9_